MLLRLNVLGGLSLLVDGRQVGRRLSQRRRLALLALVGMEGEHGITRDRVASFLWPDTDEERSRHALAQLLYIVRRDLGVDDLFVGQDVLRLHPDRISIDALELLDARRRGDDAGVVERFRGPFLDGVHIAESVEFQHWVDGQRQRLGAEFEGAADRLVTLARAAGDLPGAVSLARRRAHLSPFDSRGAAQLIDVLVDAGDCAAAMRFAEQHDTLIRDELGHAPDRVFADSVRRLRAHQQLPTAPSAVPDVTPAVTPGLDQESTGAAAAIVPPAAPLPARRMLSRGRVLAGGLAVAVLAIVSITANARSSRRVDPEPNRVAVLPFDIRAAKDLGFLGTGLVDLVSASLEATGVLRPADPRFVVRIVDSAARQPGADHGATMAMRAGAPLFVTGSLVESESRVRLTATLYRTDAPATPIASANADGTRDELFTLVDRVALALVAGRLGGMAARFEGLADKSTSSLAAIRAYVEGEAAFGAGRYRDAIEAFRRATQEDSAFALAYYRLTIAYDWAGYSPTLRQGAADAAVRQGARLPSHERELLHAMQLMVKGGFGHAYDICRQIVADYPHDVAALDQLAELEFHYNPWLGRRFTDARETLERVAALAPEAPGPPLHLARIAAFEGRTRDMDSLMSVYTLLSKGDRDPETVLFWAVARHDVRTRDSVLARMGGSGADTLAGAAWRVMQYSFAPDISERVIRGLLRPARSRAERLEAFELLANLWAAGDSWPAARSAVDSMARMDLTRSQIVRGRIALVPSLHVPLAELRAVRDDLERAIGNGVAELDSPLFGHDMNPDIPRVYVAGQLSGRLDDAAGVNRALARMATFKESTVGRGWLEISTAALRADSLRLAGHVAAAYALLRTSGDTALRHDFWVEAAVRDRLARLAMQLGQRDEAERWYASFAGGFWPDLTYVPGAERQLAALARARGDTAGVHEHERRLALLTANGVR